MAVKADGSNTTLQRIKKNVGDAYEYFEDNVKRYREFRHYVFKHSISDQQKTTLQQLNRPVVEFNILEAYISRLLGEFSKHEPSISVHPAEGVPIPDPVLDTVEGHIRHIFSEANKDAFAYNIYKDVLSGGFSVAKVWTDYASPMSFHQKIYLDRVFDPTLTGFDPLARAPHKGDGNFSFEVFPMPEKEFKMLYPEADVYAANIMMDVEGFKWNYKSSRGENIILVADYYEKKKKTVEIIQMANGRVLSVKDYKKLKEYWDAKGFIEQLPAQVGNSRWTELTVIDHYKFTQNQILEYQETDYAYLPHVFVDGNSINLTIGNDNTTYQMTRPYVYHAKGVQDMMNWAGQTVCNSMENLIQHKFILKKEAIPQEQDYVDALTDIQRASTVVVNAYSNNQPDKPIPEPIREVQNLPLPPEVLSAFQMSAPITQTILGSFASNLGKNDNDLSGKAVIETASIGNAAAEPYVVGYLQALTQIGNIIVDLMPKYLIGKRSIAVVNKNGDNTLQPINSRPNPMLDYNEKAIHVEIEAGVNYQVQKNQAVEQIIALSRSNEELGQFFNSEEGLPILVKNLTIYGADMLPEAVEKWMAKRQEQQQQAMQMQQQAMQNSPQMMRAQADLMKVQQQGQQNQFDNQMDIAEMAIRKEEADAKLMEAESKVTNSQIETAVRLEENESSVMRHALDSATKLAEIRQREEEHHLKKSQIQKDTAKVDEEME